MKRLLLMLSVALMSVLTLHAQTTDEIISRMETEFEAHQSEGIIMTMDIKIALVGDISTRIMSLGDKYCATIADGSTITWGDGKTTWTYDLHKDEVTIEKATAGSDASENVSMLKGITAGYKVKLVKETSQAWYFKCKKLSSNKNKDDIKKMELVVDKETYYPVSMTSKGLLASVAIRDVSFGVTEDQVTYNPALYSDAKIVDKR